MGLPGYIVDIVDVPPTPAATAKYSNGFFVGSAVSGVTDGEAYSIDQFQAIAGVADPSTPLWDSVQLFFREGGAHCFFSTVALAANAAALEAALNAFTKDMGPGQISIPGNTVVAVQEAVMAHAIANDRVAILDGTDTAVAATLITQAAALTASPGSRFAALFAPWDKAPGVAGGVTRTVPPCARIMGNIARNDGQGFSTNDPAAGPLGYAQYVQDLTQPPFIDSDRLALNNAGVNVSRVYKGSVQTYGFRSLASQSTDNNWSMFSNSRCVMAIKAALTIVADNFEFSKLDGNNVNISKYKAAIIAALTPFYVANDLFGTSPAAAFSVDVGPAQNTLTTLANGELHARVGLRTSPFAEQVFIDVAKVPITESLVA